MFPDGTNHAPLVRITARIQVQFIPSVVGHTYCVGSNLQSMVNYLSTFYEHNSNSLNWTEVDYNHYTTQHYSASENFQYICRLWGSFTSFCACWSKVRLEYHQCNGTCFMSMLVCLWIYLTRMLERYLWMPRLVSFIYSYQFLNSLLQLLSKRILGRLFIYEALVDWHHCHEFSQKK